MCFVGLAKTNAGTPGPVQKMSLEDAPRKKILGAAEVYEKTGHSRRTVYRLLQAGLFPEPFSLPGVRKRVWLEATIDKYIDAAAEASEEA